MNFENDHQQRTVIYILTNRHETL